MGSECVTLVEDKESGSSRRSIFVSLYPLAEWIAFNWWFLHSNTRPATSLSRLPGHYDSLWTGYGNQYRQRHSLRGAGDGFLWPNLFILPEGETTRLAWRADPPELDEGQIRFLTSGNFAVDGANLSQRLTDFIEAVIQRLNEEGVGQSALAAEWTTIQSADSDEADFCAAAARLGLDPYSEAPKYEHDILTTAQELTDLDLLRDFLDVVDPDKMASTLRWVSAARTQIDSLASLPIGEIAELRAAARTLPIRNTCRPWETGWEQARLIRQAAGVDPTDSFDVERLISTVTRETISSGLQALGGAREGTSPLLVLSHRQPNNAKKFTLARAMWHILWQEPTTFLITSAHTDRQQIERAFAAELLAPAEGISARMVDDTIHSALEEPALEELAHYYGVSTILVQHQIENQILPSW